MTVANLWKVLDEAGCGVAVGVHDMLDPSHQKKLANPWTYNNLQHSSRKSTTLAVDLSIWICEGLTSTAMASNHSRPALHLAYTRSMKLLNSGIKLIIVIEGKRRVRQIDEADKFHRRRSGTSFWKACKDCEEMFGYMGVPTFRAKAEGEALCALLSMRGIVDGVISNDGDCLLFGAKVVYTKFSVENLQNSEVMRYESPNLKALVDPEETDVNQDVIEDGKILLSRLDLVTFALLTGSDLAGDGFPKVGCKKAIRFICKSKFDYPLNTEKAAIDELRSWAKTADIIHNIANGNESILVGGEKGRCCSICNHPGDKRNHIKNGCITCGTKPGEPCFPCSSSDKFRQNLREKALTLHPKFDPYMVVDAYMNPNCNQIPIAFESASSNNIEMEVPRIKEFLKSSLIIKGQSISSSREFIMESLSKLLVRQDLFGARKGKKGRHSMKRSLSKESPIPTEIKRCVVRDQTQCYEVSWKVNATVTDSEGNDIDGYEFSTIEAQDLVQNRYPDLVAKFRTTEKEKQKQGDTEKARRQEFLETLLNRGTTDCKEDIAQNKKKRPPKKRVQENFFNFRRAKRAKRRSSNIYIKETDEIKAMMQRYNGKDRIGEDFDFSTIASGSLLFHISKKKKHYGKPKERMYDIEPVGMTITVFQQSAKKDGTCIRQKSFEQQLVPLKIDTMVASHKHKLLDTTLPLERSAKKQLNEKTDMNLKMNRRKPETSKNFSCAIKDPKKPLQKPNLRDGNDNKAAAPSLLQQKRNSLQIIINRKSDVCVEKDKPCVTALSQEDIPINKWFQKCNTVWKSPTSCCEKVHHPQKSSNLNQNIQNETDEQRVYARAQPNDLTVEIVRNESKPQQQASMKPPSHLQEPLEEHLQLGTNIRQPYQDADKSSGRNHNVHGSYSRVKGNSCRDIQHNNCAISHHERSEKERVEDSSIPGELAVPEATNKIALRNGNCSHRRIYSFESIDSYENKPKLTDKEYLQTARILDGEIKTPSTPHQKYSSPFDPNAWIERVTIDANHISLVDKKQIRSHRPNRRLEMEFDHCISTTSEMPSLTSSSKNVVVCDMGIPIQVTPLKTRQHRKYVCKYYFQDDSLF